MPPPRSALLLVSALVFGTARPSSARGEGWEWHGAGGGQIDADPHGVADVGVRRGPFSIQLFTDTLEVRYEPQLPHGRYFVAARGEALAAGLLISPWTNGAPDPGRALFASYVGLTGGYVRYLPASFYAGAAASERLYFFSARSGTTVPVPDTTPLLSADGMVGRYTEDLHIWARAGLDLQGTSPSPHAAVEAVYAPVAEGAKLAPIIELRAGWGWKQTDLTRTRLGGLNPYVVPLAGAAWAEWWVERYAAGRAGLLLRTRYTEIGAAVDAAAFNDTVATGFALLLRGHLRRYFAEAAVGYAPWVPRQEGISRASLWIEAGTRWSPR